MVIDKKPDFDSNVRKRERVEYFKRWSKSRGGHRGQFEKGVGTEERPEPWMVSPGERAELDPACP